MIEKHEEGLNALEPKVHPWAAPCWGKRAQSLCVEFEFFFISRVFFRNKKKYRDLYIKNYN